MLPFDDGPVIRENIIAKILFVSCSEKISYRENFRVYGILLVEIDARYFHDSVHEFIRVATKVTQRSDKSQIHYTHETS